MHTGWTTAENSICPKGWQLPPFSDTKSYNYLIRDISTYYITATDSDADILASPLSFVRLGHYDPSYGSLNDRGKYGRYWSSTAYSATASCYLRFYSGTLSPQDGASRATGFSIRCVSR